MKKYSIVILLAFVLVSQARAQWNGTNPVYTTANVGIGINPPLTPLHVVNSGSGGPANTVTPNQGILIGAANTNGTLNLGVDAVTVSGSFYSWIQARHKSSNAYYSLALNPYGGNVGIGLNNPINPLDVNGIGRFRRNGSSVSGATIGGGGISLQGWDLNNPYIEWRNMDNTRQGYMGWNKDRLSLILENNYNFTIESGKVGIGSSSPSTTLHVATPGNGGPANTVTPNQGVLIGAANTNGALNLGVDGVTGTFYSWIQARDKSANTNYSLSLNPNGGNVGIGISNPLNTLDVNGIGRFRRNGSSVSGATIGGGGITLQGWDLNNPYIEWRNLDNTRQGYMGWNKDRLSLIMENGYNFTVENGNVGIGTSVPDAKLTVKGHIHTEEVRVDLSVPGPDYVFEPDYNLSTLAEVEAYIKANKHLPEVPSAKQMAEEGLNLKEMNLLLLKKVEELTLHLIEQQKQITELKQAVEDIKN